jgi:hypothetical protein
MTKEGMRGWLCDGDPVFNVFTRGRCGAGRARHSVRAVRLRIQEACKGLLALAIPLAVSRRHPCLSSASCQHP